MSDGYSPTTLGDALREISESESRERWPGAPEPTYDDDGNVANAVVAECPACGDPSTLGYRCSECGKDLAASGGAK